MPCPKKVGQSDRVGARNTPYLSPANEALRQRIFVANTAAKGRFENHSFPLSAAIGIPTEIFHTTRSVPQPFCLPAKALFSTMAGAMATLRFVLFLTLLLPLSFPRPPPHRTKSPGPYLECAVSLNRDQPPQCPPASLGFATQPQTATPAPATFVLALAVDPDTVWVLRSPAVLVLPQVLAVRSPPSAKVLAAPVFRRELLRLLPISSLWVFARIRWRYFSCERYHFVQNLLGRAAHEVAVSFRCTEMSGGRRSLAANDQNIARRDCAVGGNPDGEVAEVPLNPKGLIAEALTEVFPRRPRGFASATSVAPL